MDIFETLQGDHRDIRELLNEVIHQTSTPVPDEERPERSEDWEEAFHDLKVSIVGHNRAEEATLYDHLRQLPQQAVLADSKTHEHHQVEELLEDLEEINPQDKSWDTKIALLQNQIEAHFAEEEGTTFERVRPTLNTKTNSRLAEEFTSLRDDIVESVKYHPKGRSMINPAGLDLEG
jgi:hemerythrin superfamily protein